MMFVGMLGKKTKLLALYFFYIYRKGVFGLAAQSHLGWSRYIHFNTSVVTKKVGKAPILVQQC